MNEDSFPIENGDFSSLPSLDPPGVDPQIFTGLFVFRGCRGGTPKLSLPRALTLDAEDEAVNLFVVSFLSFFSHPRDRGLPKRFS